ncbi:MAG: flagellin [Negativicutes bacterium]
MIINHNMASVNTYGRLSANNAATSKSLEKLSSGLRINRAGDDAAGLAMSEKMRAQIRGLDQASSNSQDAISLIQTAEGALTETHSILQRMRELAVQSSTDTNTADDRSKIQSEIDELAKEITRISNTTEFNTKNLLAGGLSTTFHVGANQDQNLRMTVGALDAQSLGVASATVNTTFTNTATGISTLTTTSPNLNNYYVTSDFDAASAGAVTQSRALGGAGTANVTGFTGSADVTFQVKIGSADGTGKVTSASYTTDGGTTWSAATVDSTGADGIATLADGAKITIATDADNAVADTYTFAATAEKISLGINTLANGTGTAVGTSVVVHNNQSSATLGSSSSNQVAGVTFSFATLKGKGAAVVGDKITQTVTTSTAAVIGADGTVTTNAVTQKGIDVSTQGAANSAITTIDNAIKTVSAERGKMGAIQNRLEHTINNLDSSSENITAAESRIRDVDMAKEMMNFQKNSILSQAATAMLAQANQQPQTVLQLLQS